jgi:hypothetical protein
LEDDCEEEDEDEEDKEDEQEQQADDDGEDGDDEEEGDDEDMDEELGEGDAKSDDDDVEYNPRRISSGSSTGCVTSSSLARELLLQTHSSTPRTSTIFSRVCSSMPRCAKIKSGWIGIS